MNHVIPEIGFDEEPISPVMGEETVAKKKPNTKIRPTDKMLIAIPVFAVPVTVSQIIIITDRIAIPPITKLIDKSRSVRGIAPSPFILPPPKLPTEETNGPKMAGKARIKLMIPPVATAPAAM